MWVVLHPVRKVLLVCCWKQYMITIPLDLLWMLQQVLQPMPDLGI